MDFIRINNRSNFLLHTIPSIHPASIRYINFWRKEKKKIIEGFWGPDDADIKNYDVHENSLDINTSKWRYMPPQLYFYVNYGTILHTPEGSPKTAPKKRIRPLLRDIEWEFFYNWLEARGFSGFYDDDEITCNINVKKHNEEDEDAELDKTCFKKNGQLKTFVPARVYLRQLFTKPLGIPIYMNEAKNLFMLGARGFGKSYSVGDGVAAHELLTDGAKIYNEESIQNPALIEIFVGAAVSSKSSEILSKTVLCMNELPGTWMKGTDQEIPTPLYKEMAGSLEPNNIKNPWRHEYEKKINGKWKKYGSGSAIKHGIYTTENPEAAAGGRYTVMIIEEVGLLSNVLTVTGSNNATQLEGTVKFGSSVYLGTGGNMEKIVESEIIFRDPEGFDFLAFDDIWENKGKIGWFVPAYYALNQYKDENGNTDVDAALRFINKRREKRRKAKSQSAITLEILSYPIVPSEMFLKRSGNFFPVEDLKFILSELEVDEKLLDSSWKGEFVIDKEGKVKYKNSFNHPIRSFPLRTGESMDGVVEIFEMPKTNKDGEIISGRYIAGTDPVDDDGNSNTTLSLQSSFILDTFTDRIVAEYTSRTQLAEEYYETLRRLLIFYNAKVNYEQNKKGLFGYFKNRNSTYLLAETPQILSDTDLAKISSIGNKKYGTVASEKVNEWGRRLYLSWLLNEAYGREEGVMNMHTIRSVALLKESISWSKDINADRISAMIMLMIYREEVIQSIDRDKKDVKDVNNNDFWDKLYKSHYSSNNVKTYNKKSYAQNNLLNW